MRIQFNSITSDYNKYQQMKIIFALPFLLFGLNIYCQDLNKEAELDEINQSIEIIKSKLVDEKYMEQSSLDALDSLEIKKLKLLADTNNSNSRLLEDFLSEFPMFKENLYEYYFEIVNMRVVGGKYKYFFNVFKRVEITDPSQRKVKYYSIKNRKVVEGNIHFILFPIVHNAASPTGNYTPPPVSQSVKYIIHGPLGAETLWSFHLR